MGSHTFVFAGLVLALRFKYKRGFNRLKQRRTGLARALISDSDSNHVGPLPPVIGRVGVPGSIVTGEASTMEKWNTNSPVCALTTAQTSGLEYAHRSQGYHEPKSSIRYENIEEELEMRYQAFSILSWIVVLYIVLVQFWGAIALGWFISARHPSIPAGNHINAWWSGIFLSASAFNNSGMSLIDANMVPFQLSYFILFVMSALILLGNTLFPILLRIIVQCLAWIIPEGDKWQGWRNGMRLLVNEKSRILCPYLFTRNELFWLTGTILIFNGIDWVSLTNYRNMMYLLLIFSYYKGGLWNFCCRGSDIQRFPSSGSSGRWFIPSVRRQKRWICSRRHFFFENRRSSNLCTHVSFCACDPDSHKAYHYRMYISSFPISPDNVWKPDMPESNMPELISVGPRNPKLAFLKRQFSRTFTVDDFWYVASVIFLLAAN